MATLNDLTQNLTLQKDDGPITAVRLVKGYDNSYALNAAGDITALSLGNSNIKKLVLGKESEALEYLYLSSSESLKEVVFEVPLPHLTHLYLNKCAIKQITFPPGFRALQQIYLQKNGLQRLVFEGDCPSLVLMDMSENKLQEFYLPFSFEKLEYLYLGGQNNIIQNIPREIVESGTNSCEAIKAFFRASLQSGDILNHEAKCIFFGNGRAGKTTLSHQLRRNEFDPTIKYTHGILIEEWEIFEQDFSQELREKIEKEKAAYRARRSETLPNLRKIQLNVWDFGGQEYFHATHRLFLNNNVLYLLVWEKATDHQNEETGDYPASYWQDNINHYAPQNITLTVQNKERGNAAIDHTKNRYKIALRTDSKPQNYALDAEELKEAVFRQLPRLNYLCVPIPKLYDDIRQALRNIKAIKPYLLFDDYKNLCQRIDKTPDKIMQNESDLKSLTTFLHETGCIICYRYDDKKKSNALDNYVFINPQWVTQTIYYILDEGILAEKGEFDRLHVADVLADKQNVIRDATIWLNLMTEFELIFQKKGEENQFITPQYLPKNCQDLSEKAWNNLIKELPYQLVLHYPDFLPKSVISRFICRYGNLAEDYYWKYGIVFHSEGEEAHVRCDYGQKTITVQTKTPLSSLSKEIFETLRVIDSTDSLEIAVSEDENPKQLTGFVNFKKLKERVEKGKTDIEWNGEEFDITLFAGLLHREPMGPDKETRGLGSEAFGVKSFIDNSEPYPVSMADGARTFVPFSEIKERIKILFLASGTLNTGLESRFKGTIKRWADEGRFEEVKDEHGVDEDSFKAYILKIKPHILHYGGHGQKEGIILEKGVISSDTLIVHLKIVKNVQCVILNACNSFEIAKTIAEVVPYVVATQAKVDDNAAVAFTNGFYRGIATECTIEDAFILGLDEVKSKENKEVFILLKGIPKT